MRMTAAAATSLLALRPAAALRPRDRDGAASAALSVGAILATRSLGHGMASRHRASGATLYLALIRRVTIG